tara:strand:+ start:558 stop:2372 length:1815 start_codon:yes stop_codon:yes gene_type:complete
MSYWRNDELETIKQTQTTIPSANGLNYSSGDRIEINIPPTIQLFDGKSSYLNFDVKINADEGVPTRLVLDGVCGAQSLLKNIRIYGNNVLLEEISGYNVKVNVQYWYDADASLRNLRAIKEGCLTPTVQNRGDTGGSVPVMVNTVSCPYYVSKVASPQNDEWDFDDDNLTAKVSLPLHTGIFAESFHAFPNFLFSNGLKLEIDLEDEERVVKQLESVNRNRLIHMNPIFWGKTDAGGDWDADGSTSDEFYLSFDNNMNEVANVPFVVGERINFCEILNPIGATANVSHLQNPAAAYTLPLIDRIELDNTVAPPRIKITFDDTYTNPAASNDIEQEDWCVYSAALDTQTNAPSSHAATSDYDVSLLISNVEMVMQHIELSSTAQNKMISDMRNDGALEIDILTATNYKHSTLKENRFLTLNLPISNTKAKSMIIVPCDSEVYDDTQLIASIGTYEVGDFDDGIIGSGYNLDVSSNSYQTGYSGIMDELSSYQFNIDDKLVPSRPINVADMNSGKKVMSHHLIEVEKSLNQARIVPRSFRGFVDNFVIGRAFALYDGVADLRNRTNQVQLTYNTDNDDPSKNKLFNCFVFHIRTISIKGENVSVEL